MLEWLAQRRGRKRTAQDLYGSIVALSRQDGLYADFGVPDTVEGRFEILVIHMFLILDRLGQDSAQGNPLAQELVDAFFADMDTTIRQLGVGDFSVPKKMRHLATVFDQRLNGYRDATEAPGSDQLRHLLAENIELKDGGKNGPAGYLEKYIVAAMQRLAQQTTGEAIERLISGTTPFPGADSSQAGP
ncbi:MAG: ubiquinol-cytochrome C chaperone [Hyphomicrobiales bacterium]|nr:ubiquinol-cytochrome C chaperone [Hyphomicrobiales bacterium]